MNIIELIEKKKRGKEFSFDEWKFIVDGYMNDVIPDYQMSALFMAIYFKGMTLEETIDLTDLTVKSGDHLDFSDISNNFVDKHSTGGVGDKITLILLPILAAAGIECAKLSGRGLGKTGGTIDKLESIPGFDANLSSEKFEELIRKNKVAISGQTKNLTPLDGKMYALRDITATIDIIPLIAVSIVSKKIAAGANHIILDVKCGEGAFMEDLASAKKLASTMRDVGKHLGRNISCVITNMNQPLGRAVGNAVEVIESIEFLKGNYTNDLRDLVFEQAALALLKTKKCKTREDAISFVKELIASGEALNQFGKIIEAQNGNSNVLNDYSLFPQAQNKVEIKSAQEGFVSNISAIKVSKACKLLGAGRIVKNAPIDLAAGVFLNKKYGEFVNKNDTIATLYFNKDENAEEAKQLVQTAFDFNLNKPKEQTMIYEIIE